MGESGGVREVFFVPKYEKTGSAILEHVPESFHMDLHPCEPWVLFAARRNKLDGSDQLFPDNPRWSVQVWNYEDGTRVASWEVFDTLLWVPSQGLSRGEDASSFMGKFIAQKDWIVVRFGFYFKVYAIQGSSVRKIEELQTLRWDSQNIYDYTSAGGMAVHYCSSYLLTGFGNGQIILWDWAQKGQNWKKKATFKGNQAGTTVTTLMFHPRQPHVFASASDDGTIRIWDINTGYVFQTLKDSDVTDKMGCPASMEFHCGQQSSLLITGHGGGDHQVRVWDYARRLCVTRLAGHGDAICSAFFHPHLPYIFSASSDGKIKVWRESDYHPVSSFCSKMKCLVSMAASADPGNNKVVIGGKGEFEVVEICTRGKEDPREELRKEMNRMIDEAIHARYRTEQEVVSVELKYKKELDTVRAAHREKEGSLANRVVLLEDEVRDLKSESCVMTERIQQLESERNTLTEKSQQLQVELENMISEKAVAVEELEKSTGRVQQLESEKIAMVKNFKKRIDEMEQRFESEVAASDAHEYSLEELLEATDNFNDNMKCGDKDHIHGLEFTYRAKLRDGTPVMIMKLNRTSTTSSIETMIDRRMFKEEVVNPLRMLRHPHLLTLLGVCYEQNCLVYEDMANGSVKELIACDERCPSSKPIKGSLPWYVRFRVMTEVARGVSFLHANRSVTGSAIIHSAIRPANILLDGKLEAKICQVEQALLNSQIECKTKGVQALGALGHDRTLGAFVGSKVQYIAPEYLRTKVCNEKTDIYAFGITVLEMLTGNFTDAFGIIEEAIEDDTAAFENALDPNAGPWDVELAKEVAALGLRCATLDKRSRPVMMDADFDILGILEGVAGKVQLAAPEEDR